MSSNTGLAFTTSTLMMARKSMLYLEPTLRTDCINAAAESKNPPASPGSLVIKIDTAILFTSPAFTKLTVCLMTFRSFFDSRTTKNATASEQSTRCTKEFLIISPVSFGDKHLPVAGCLMKPRFSPFSRRCNTLLRELQSSPRMKRTTPSSSRDRQAPLVACTKRLSTTLYLILSSPLQPGNMSTGVRFSGLALPNFGCMQFWLPSACNAATFGGVSDSGSMCRRPLPPRPSLGGTSAVAPAASRVVSTRRSGGVVASSTGITTTGVVVASGAGLATIRFGCGVSGSSWRLSVT
mmetsp:Transcript_22024/g.61651  ORF Transcript_22024/g.61651 Transcript_22024/m.61651 type:complete len:294 (-) Transcript_22024:301-1182(-)